MLTDFRWAVRTLLRSPSFTAAAVATLAVGIGANTAIFSIVNILALKPLPYHDPHRVAFAAGWDTERQDMRFNLSLADVIELQRQTRTLEQVAAYGYWSANLAGSDQPERVQAYRVTANTFALLGAPPLLGRTFAPNEGRPGGADIVVMSHGLWQRRFGADPAIVGRHVRLDGRPHTVIGVMPQRFEFPVFNFKGDLWVPYRFDPAAVVANRAQAEGVVAIARIRSAVDYATAQAEVDAVMRRLEVDHPRTNRAVGVRLIEIGKLDEEQIIGSATWIPLAAVALVLLLACANVANLLLVHGIGRRRELAVRSALGAGRWRVVRQLLVESVLLAAAGGTLGTLLAVVGLDALRASLPELLVATQPLVSELGVDRTGLLFTLGLTVVTAIVFGLMPALKTAGRDLQDALKQGSLSLSGAVEHQRVRGAVVVVEVALATTLVAAAGLLVRSVHAVQRLDPGFNRDSVLTMTISLPEYRYGERRAQRQFFEQAMERISRLPGVASAAFVNVLPFSTYNRGRGFLVEGARLTEPGREPGADYRVITPGYFRTLAIPIVQGRAFSERDREGSVPVVIVNRELVRRHFPKGDPIGRRIRFGGRDSTEAWQTIVGIVGDVRHWQLTDRPAPEVYVPLAQAPTPMMMLAARTAGDPETLAAAARAEILAIDRDQPVYHVKTLARLVDDSLLPKTTTMAMMALFGVIALLLAAIGVYGVIAYAVRQQMREIGVRMALGARPSDVRRLVLGRGLALVVGGVGLGVVGALVATRVLGSMLYAVKPSDPLTYLAACGLLVVVALSACYVPARRASSVDPATVLRAE